jgi:threonine synthase
VTSATGTAPSLNGVTLVCCACAETTPAGAFGGCPSCGGVLGLPPAEHPPAVTGAPQLAGIWDRLGDLGIDGLQPVSLGEGRTPLVPLSRRDPRHFLKLEGCNPTGSWKDRLQAVNTAVALRFGYPGMALVSTGNSALAAAAYAARANLALRAHLWTTAPKTIVEAVRRLGADVRMVTEAPELRRALEEEGLFPATMSPPVDVGNPFGLEGYRTIAYEIVDALADVPEWVVVPVGCGDGLHAIAKGFADLVRWGRTRRVPRMLAAQSAAAAPLVAAFDAGADHVKRVTANPTVAISIADPIAGDHALATVRRTGGAALAVDDAEIAAACAELQRAGVVAEAASASTVAAVARARRRSIIAEGDVVVSVITSSGLRWIH